MHLQPCNTIPAGTSEQKYYKRGRTSPTYWLGDDVWHRLWVGYKPPMRRFSEGGFGHGLKLANYECAELSLTAGVVPLWLKMQALAVQAITNVPSLRVRFPRLVASSREEAFCSKDVNLSGPIGCGEGCSYSRDCTIVAQPKMNPWTATKPGSTFRRSVHTYERGLGNDPDTYNPHKLHSTLHISIIYSLLLAGNLLFIIVPSLPTPPCFVRMIDLPSICFGLFLGIFPFTVVRVIQQSRKILRRSRTFYNAYLYMIWAEGVASFIFAVITYLYLIGVVHGSLGFFLGTVILWAAQTQLLSQIIANRVGLIMLNKRKAMWLKLSLIFAIGCINIVVGVIWIRGHMPSASPKQIHLNNVFEKFGQTFFLLLDLGLNLYFLYLVWFHLIALGLDKYWLLFKVNLGVVFLATAMDAVSLGLMCLPDSYLYAQFNPVAYIIKLYIELIIATLIVKIVRSRNDKRFDYWRYSVNDRPNINADQAAFPVPGTAGNSANVNTMEGPLFGNHAQISNGGDKSDMQLAKYAGDGCIMKTVTTIVVTETGKERGSTNLSERKHENLRDCW